MLEDKLHEYYGYNSFRKGQKETIESVLSGCDTLTQLPTGTGKSLCYQLAGKLMEGIVVIISPLISLMEDQVHHLLESGEENVAYINSSLMKSEKEYIIKRIATYKYIFMSPEMIQNERILTSLSKLKIALLVIDEAHCISMWGMDFRPEYRELGNIKRVLGFPTTLCLTASATPAVRKDIRQILLNDEAREFIYSIDRPNVALVVQETYQKKEALESLMNSSTEATIIYSATRKTVEEIYETFKSSYSIGYYHGGLTSSERSLLQKQFQTNQLQFLVATNAFGMGINKPDIRYVIHYDIPDSIENYVQEIGRAGRDGSQSYAILLYQAYDERIHHFFQENLVSERIQVEFESSDLKEVSESTLKGKWRKKIKNNPKFIDDLKSYEKEKVQKIQKMVDYVYTKGCRRKYLINYFYENETEENLFCCDLHGVELPEKEKRKNDKLPKNENENWQEILRKIFKDFQ